MKVLIRQALITDPSSPFHSQRADILIDRGKISDIAASVKADADQVVQAHDLAVSPGWVDIFSHFGDPGSEFAETIETGAAAAAAGGYTQVMVLPNTQPVMHSKSMVEYIRQKQPSAPVDIFPAAAITTNTEGKELAEMYDMDASGALAFTDGLNPLQSAGVMLKALQYVKAIGKTIIQLPDDRSIQPHGLMHEGVLSTQLGLAGKPSIAEELMIMRDIDLLRYTGSRLHITGISTARSLELVKAAKNEGLQITCSVTPYHLYFTDEDLSRYDSNLKVNPPLRTAKDRDALRQGVLDGSIDCIASHHLPRHTDDKVIEFEHAKNGMISLQTSFSAVIKAIPTLTTERIIELFAIAPRNIFGLPPTTIKKGENACLTVFSLNSHWTFSGQVNRSRSGNSPFMNTSFTARPIGIINKGGLFLTP